MAPVDEKGHNEHHWDRQLIISSPLPNERDITVLEVETNASTCCAAHHRSSVRAAAPVAARAPIIFRSPALPLAFPVQNPQHVDGHGDLAEAPQAELQGFAGFGLIGASWGSSDLQPPTCTSVRP